MTTCIDKEKLIEELTVKIEREIGRERGGEREGESEREGERGGEGERGREGEGGVRRMKIRVFPCPLHDSTDGEEEREGEREREREREREGEWWSTAISAGSFVQVAGHPDSLLLASLPYREREREREGEREREREREEVDGDCIIAKQVVAQELAVYEKLLRADPSLCACPLSPSLSPPPSRTLSNFFCTVKGIASKEGKTYILLSRYPTKGLLTSFKVSPRNVYLSAVFIAKCVMNWNQIDVKLGTSTVYPSAPLGKAKAAQAKDEACSSAVLGLRLTGGRVCRERERERG
jgi:hypothetical protein